MRSESRCWAKRLLAETWKAAFLLSALALVGAGGCAEKKAQEVVKDLKYGDPEVRDAAAKQLLGLGSFAVGPLVEVLEDGEAQEQYIAVQILGKLRDPRAVEPLMKVAAGHEHEHVQAAAIEALGILGDARALPMIQHALADSMEVVRDRAAFVIGGFRDPSVVPAVIEALRDTSATVRKSAISSILRLRPTVFHSERALQDGKPDAEPLPPGVSTRVLTDGIAQRVDDSDETVRYVAVQALGRLRDTTTVDLLIRKLDDRSTYVRQEAATALSLIGDRRAVEPLIDFLARSDRLEEPVIKRALKALTGRTFELQD